jgi:two-component system phosphate regulon sensor histidine kinase PhoR
MDSGRLQPTPLELLENVTVLQHVNDALVLVSDSHQVVWLNRLARHLFGTHDSAIGKSVMEVLRDHRLDQLVGQALATHEEKGLEFGALQGRRTLRARAIPNSESVWLIIEDLTRLRHLETVRQDFVANLSHELRTPLSGLRLAAETVSRQLGASDEASLFLDRIKDEAERLDLTIRNLTQLAALEGNEVPFSLKPFEVRPLLEQSAARFAQRAEDRGLQLRIDAEPGELYAIGDLGKVDQALTNILENALKFTTSGSVTITGLREEGWIGIRVADTGPGIPPHELPRIFERFFKVDRARGTRGSGLGLSIARHLVEQQGGRIRAESEPGKGTVMTILLPSARPDPTP